jgi:predicted HAD superfamily Cof-like phosphohydrolase
MNRNNWLSNKPSTRVHHAPGGNSSFSLGWNSQQQQPAKPVEGTNVNKSIKQKAVASVIQHGQHVASTDVRPASHTAGAVSQLPPPKIPCHATAVREFTQACGFATPNAPQLMNRPEVQFITKMLLDELLELNATVMSPNEAKNSILNMLNVAKNCPQLRTTNKAEIVAEQADALVDIWYYCLNCAIKKGINLCSVFDLVHAANMRKVNPATGKCIKRADGKIEKPAGWCPPDISKEMQRQHAQGSFS